MGEPLPLAGIKVVEMTVAVAGPATGMILGDWGADVVLVEAPGGGRGGLSALAGVPVESQYQDSPQGYMDNRGKRSVVLDLKTDEGKAAMEKLLSGADVFLSNFRAQALEGLNLGPEQVHARFPKLVCALLTGYGRTGGPADDKPGYEGSGFWARSSAAWQFKADADFPPREYK